MKNMSPNNKTVRSRIQRQNSRRYSATRKTSRDDAEANDEAYQDNDPVPFDEDDEPLTLSDVAYEISQALVDLCDAFRAEISAQMRSELLSAVDTRKVLAQNASDVTDGNFSGTGGDSAESAIETLSNVGRATVPEWSLSDIPPEKRHYLFPALQILHDYLPHGLALADLFSAFEDAGYYRFALPAPDAEVSGDA